MTNLEFLQKIFSDKKTAKEFLKGSESNIHIGGVCNTDKCPKLKECEGACLLDDSDYIDIWLDLEKDDDECYDGIHKCSHCGFCGKE